MADSATIPPSQTAAQPSLCGSTVPVRETSASQGDGRGAMRALGEREGVNVAAPDTAPPRTNHEVAHLTGAVQPLWLHFFERKLLLGVVDGLLINFALFVALTMRPFPLRRGPDLSWQALSQLLTNQWSWFVILTSVWFVCALMLDCYNLAQATDVLDSMGRLSGAVFLTSLIYLLIPRITPVLPSSRLDVLSFPLLGLAGIVVWRLVYARVLVQPNFQQRALVVGAGSAGQTLVTAIRRMHRGNGEGADRNFGYHVIGFIDDDPAKQGSRVEGMPVLGTRHTLVDLAQRLQPNEIVVAITHEHTMHGELFEALLTCHELGFSITTMATLYERLTGRVPIEHAGRALYVAMPVSRPVTHRFYLAFKRLLDIGVALLGCLLLVGIIPLVWLVNVISSPGPLFYSQLRVGKGGRTFAVLKFRSMTVDAEKFSGPIFAAENDSRITPVGRILRRTRLDEFPQFWTILKGDMSLIGPRPERPYFVDQLTKQIPFYRVRHAVRPGLTGWSQVMYRYGASFEDSVIKLQYDLYYIKRQNVFLDLHILLKTIPVVMGFKGR